MPEDKKTDNQANEEFVQIVPHQDGTAPTPSQPNTPEDVNPTAARSNAEQVMNQVKYEKPTPQVTPENAIETFWGNDATTPPQQAVQPVPPPPSAQPQQPQVSPNNNAGGVYTDEYADNLVEKDIAKSAKRKKIMKIGLISFAAIALIIIVTGGLVLLKSNHSSYSKVATLTNDKRQYSFLFSPNPTTKSSGDTNYLQGTDLDNNKPLYAVAGTSKVTQDCSTGYPLLVIFKVKIQNHTYSACSDAKVQTILMTFKYNNNWNIMELSSLGGKYKIDATSAKKILSSVSVKQS